MFEGVFPSETEPRPFASDAECWDEGLRLLGALYHLRGVGIRNEPNHEQAEEAIRLFYRRVRISPSWVTLARLCRQERLTAEMVVLILHALASAWGVSRKDRRDAALLAVGFDPPRLGQLLNFVRLQRGSARLLVIQDDGLVVSQDLMKFLYGEFSERDLAIHAAQVAKLPVTTRTDILDCRPRPCREEPEEESEDEQS